jgi:ABC-type transport system substrate-binding protein
VTEPRTLDPASATYKHFYGTSEWDDEATEFRKAISYLSNKNKWINEILKGYGHALQTMVPYGALAGYTDYTSLGALGYIYNYNPVTAAAVLDAAGFTQGTTPNPDYDPATPGSAQYLRRDPRYNKNLDPLVFYIRMDDVLRRDVGRDLTAQLRKAGIPVNAIETDKTVCYNYVMVLYDFHLYTGGWSVSADVPNDIHGLFHSSQYWGGSTTSYYGGTGWSANYPGFVDSTFDSYAEQGKFGSTFDAVKNGGLLGQQRMAELAAIVPGYDLAAVKAFKTGWNSIVNYRGVGPDNYYSFLNGINTVNTLQNPADNEIDYAFKSVLEGPNPVTSEWLWDAYVDGFIYDTLLGRNPYDLSMDFGHAAQAWSFNPTDVPYPSATFTLRLGMTFHNGDPVTPEDIKFSIEFQKACGPGVAWSYSSYAPIIRVDTQADDATLGPRDAKVYYEYGSYWAVHWAGFSYILNRNVWMRASSNLDWGYTRGMTDFNAFTNRMDVRNYQPWLYDGDGDGIMDYKEDGSGPWVFQSYAPAGPIDVATSLYLSAFTNYILPQSAVSGFTSWAFQMIGDVNLDGSIDAVDGQAIQKALGTDSTMLPWGTDWDDYNPATDINTGTWDMINHIPLTQGDGDVNYLDIGKWGLNVGGKP